MLQFLKNFSNEILLLITGVLLMLSSFLSKRIIKIFMRQLKEMNKKIDLLIIEQQSMDYALEKSFGNGYKEYKIQKKDELIRNYEFKKEDKYENI